MDFVFTINDDGTRTLYPNKTNAPNGAGLHAFEVKTDKPSLMAAFQELFDMINWENPSETEEPEAPTVEAPSKAYQEMSTKEQLDARLFMTDCWEHLPVSYRSDLIINFMEEVVRPLRKDQSD